MYLFRAEQLKPSLWRKHPAFHCGAFFLQAPGAVLPFVHAPSHTPGQAYEMADGSARPTPSDECSPPVRPSDVRRNGMIDPNLPSSGASELPSRCSCKADWPPTFQALPTTKPKKSKPSPRQTCLLRTCRPSSRLQNMKTTCPPEVVTLGLCNFPGKLRI